MALIESLDHLVLTVADPEASVRFYCGILGCREIISNNGRRAFAFGHQKINLHVKGHEIAPHAKAPVCGSADLCFLTSTPIEIIIRILGEYGINPELGPVSREGAREPLRSVYCRDPDGNLIEISNPVRTCPKATDTKARRL